MILKQKTRWTSARKSYGLALVFVLIAVMGFVMTYSSLPQISKSNEESSPVLEEKKVKKTYESSYPIFVIKTILMTGAIIVLFVLGAKLYRKRQKSEIFDRIKMDIVSRKYIDSKHYLVMVKVHGRMLLLGVSDNSVNLISEYEDDASDENINEAGTMQKEDHFSGILKRIKIGKKD